MAAYGLSEGDLDEAYDTAGSLSPENNMFKSLLDDPYADEMHTKLFGGSSQSSRAVSGTDERVMDAFFGNFNQANRTAGRLGPKRYADFGENFDRSVSLIRGAGQGEGAANVSAAAAYGGSQPGMQAASVNRGDVRDVNAGSFLNGNVSQYMNPYNDQVVDRALGDIDRSRQIAMQSVGDRAVAAGAFGGGRHGIVEAETNRAYADKAADTAAQLRSQSFDAATALQQSDLNRAAQVGMANQGQDAAIAMQNADLLQQAGVTNLSAAQQAAELQGKLGLSQQQMDLKQSEGLFNIGMTEQALEQKRLNAEREAELERQRLRNEALGINPAGGAGRQSQSNSTGTNSGGFAGGVGDILGGIGGMFS